MDALNAAGDLNMPVEGNKPRHEQKPRKRKRKATSPPAPPAPKKFRGIRGKLSLLTEMPIDVIHEVFSHLGPIDLVHLARTSKDLRTMLMDRNFIAVWKSARSRFDPPMPDCPSDLSEPAYAELVFGRHCHYCERSLNRRAPFLSWTARRRICDECEKTICHNEPKQFLGVKIPHLPQGEKYFSDILHRWRTSYEQLTTEDQRAAWKWDLEQKQQLIRDNVSVYSNWTISYHYRLKEDKRELRRELEKNQQGIVEERVNALGWADEVARMPYWVPKFHILTETLRTCRNAPFSDRILKNIDEKIEAYMKRVRDERLLRDAQRLACFGERLHIAREACNTIGHNTTVAMVHATYHTWPCPSGAEDLFMEPQFRSVILDDAPLDSILSENLTHTIQTNLFPVAEALSLRLNQQLLFKLIHDTTFPLQYTSYSPAINNFDLATSVFRCTKCSDSKVRGLWFNDILLHPCSSELYDPSLVEGLTDIQTSFITQKRLTYRTHENSIVVDSTLRLIVLHLVVSCGLDPSTTTIGMMDELNPTFAYVGVCLFNMDWKHVAHHFLLITMHVNCLQALPRLQRVL